MLAENGTVIWFRRPVSVSLDFDGDLLAASDGLLHLLVERLEGFPAGCELSLDRVPSHAYTPPGFKGGRQRMDEYPLIAGHIHDPGHPSAAEIVVPLDCLVLRRNDVYAYLVCAGRDGGLARDFLAPDIVRMVALFEPTVFVFQGLVEAFAIDKKAPDSIGVLLPGAIGHEFHD